MISVDNITISFGGFDLFSNIGFMINSRDRIGLVGKNGAGKSTLLKVIYGLVTPTEGIVSKPSGISIGYLPQQMNLATTQNTVLEETKKAFDTIAKIQAEIDKLTSELEQRTDYTSDSYIKAAENLAHLNEHLLIVGVNNMDSEIERILKGLGFLRSDFSRKIGEFSGGWRMRVELAKILLQNPDLILLDEPTNHLDIESIQWLEEFLQNYKGAVLLISHDRAFLDNVTTRTIEINMGKIYDYKVPYSKFKVLQQERIQQQTAAYENQQKLIKDTEEFIEKFRYKPTKSNQVQSRIKQLEKLELIEIDDLDNAAMHIKFAPAPRSGDIVVECKELCKSYGDKQILDSIDLVIERGEKVAFVGRNGEGKTTLSKVIIGETEHTGELKLG
ncbi:MAG: ABC-F family ATP-binding cassette domain-containing protein, partial [Bacteroidales bacterium]|nr:ABC-F family ATP-binding cassette domain-containing protein [Bacteroidales bacterium]